MSLSELDRARKVIQELDLKFVINRLVRIDGWSIKAAKKGCVQYKNYLFLKLKYGDQFGFDLQKTN